ACNSRRWRVLTILSCAQLRPYIRADDDVDDDDVMVTRGVWRHRQSRVVYSLMIPGIVINMIATRGRIHDVTPWTSGSANLVLYSWLSYVLLRSRENIKPSTERKEREVMVPPTSGN